MGICNVVPSTAALVLNCLSVDTYHNPTNENICHFLTFYNWNYLSFSAFPGIEFFVIFCHLRNGIISHFLTFPNNEKKNPMLISDIIQNFSKSCRSYEVLPSTLYIMWPIIHLQRLKQGTHKNSKTQFHDFP